MVRLLHDVLTTPPKVHLKFQSHNGAIAAILYVDAPDGVEGFNPTMVRLLLILLSRQVVIGK